MTPRRTAVGAPAAEPAPAPAMGEGRHIPRYKLYSFDGLLSDHRPGIRFGVLSIPINGHFVYDRETEDINGQPTLPSIEASTLSGTNVEERVLDFNIEDSGLKRLMHIHARKSGPPSKEYEAYRGTYKHGHVTGTAELKVRLVFEDADFLVAQFPHVFGARKPKP